MKNNIFRWTIKYFCLFTCILGVHFSTAQTSCQADTISPTSVCLWDREYEVLDSNAANIIFARDLNDGSFDNCTANEDLRFAFSNNVTDTVYSLPDGPPRSRRRRFISLFTFDENGLFDSCRTSIIINYTFHCQLGLLDTIPPEIRCEDSIGVSFVYEDTLELKAVDFVKFRSDDCTDDDEVQISWTPNPVDSLKKFTKSNFEEIIRIYGIDNAGNYSFYETYFYNFFEFSLDINYYQDRNLNCVFDEGEQVLSPTDIEDTLFIGVTSASSTIGFPSLELFDIRKWSPPTLGDFYQHEQIKLFSRNNLYDGNRISNFSISIFTDKGQIGYQPPFSPEIDSLFASLGFQDNRQIHYGIYPSICDYEFYFSPRDFKDNTLFIDFPVYIPEEDCPVMLVEIGTPFIRRCFDNTYTIHYCNYGLEVAKDAYIDLSFDENLELVSSEKEYELIDNQQIRIQLGDVPSAFCNDFKITFNASCDADLGAIHCVEAKIFPDTLCNEPSENWSGAALEVTGNCVGDSIQFQIQNVGDGDMLNPSKFIVIEDVILREEGEVQLLVQESMRFSLPANGSFYRMQVEQVPDFPYPSVPTASIEGCGVDENGNQSFGFVNQFTPDDLQPSVAIDCQQNIGAYDPNDKQVIPTGMGEEHYTEKNIPLKYKIRFQNTGTDTAFNIIIRDTLSTHLNPTTLKMGSSSHPYDFLLLEDHIVVVRFQDVLLPDSTNNEPASHGFIEFEIKQKVDLSDGTIIRNQAAIYFDFNEPIFTNQVFNTIGIPFLRIINNISTPDFSEYQAVVMPNPLSNQAIIELKGAEMDGTVFIYNALGQQVSALSMQNNQAIFNRQQLESGIYFYKISNQAQQLILSGTLMIQGK